MRVREGFHLLRKVLKLNIAIRRSSLRVAPLLFLYASFFVYISVRLSMVVLLPYRQGTHCHMTNVATVCGLIFGSLG